MMNWQDIDWVLLDMDGTLLDLNFDNHFWNQLIPQHVATVHGRSLEEVRLQMEPMFEQHHGHMQFYDIDFWGQQLDVDLWSVKQANTDRIAWLPGAKEFLQMMLHSGKEVWIVTNACRKNLGIKHEITHILDYVHGVVSSHDIGYPKEYAEFWQALRQKINYQPERTLFVDDVAQILRSARTHAGIKYLMHSARPSSTGLNRPVEEFVQFEHWQSLSPSPLNKDSVYAAGRRGRVAGSEENK